MSSEFVSIEGKSKRYWITVALIATVVLFGFISFGVSYVEGHQVFGGSNIIPWGMPIVLVIFLIGLSAGLHILAFLIYIMNQDQYRQVIKAVSYTLVDTVKAECTLLYYSMRPLWKRPWTNF